jgi:hypothetical protein
VFSDSSAFLNTIRSMAEMSQFQIDEWENSLGFKSFYRYSYIDNPSVPESDEFEFQDRDFSRVLDEKKIVQIGRWLFKVEPFNSRVLVVHENNVRDHKNFENGLLVPHSVIELPTDANVFEIVNTFSAPPNGNTDPIYIDPDMPAIWGWFCKERRAVEKNSSKTETYTGNDGLLRIIHAKLEYQKYGVYFSLMFSVEHKYRTTTVPYNVEEREPVLLDYGFNQRYVKRCDGGPVTNNRPLDWAGNHAIIRSYKHQRCYESMANLREYLLEGSFLILPQNASVSRIEIRLTKALNKHIESL